MTAFWIGVGCLYPRDLHVCSRGGISLRSSNVEMFSGTVRVVFSSFRLDTASSLGVCVSSGISSATDCFFALDLFLLNNDDMMLLNC